MEKRMIVVKNLPSCTQDTIENYLEVVCENGVEEINFYDDRLNDIAIVTMEEEIEDIQKYKAKAGKRKLEGNTIELVEVSPPTGVLVTDMPSATTVDTLRFYFENKRAGGEEDSVTDCEMYDNQGLAKVEFKDSTIVERVLRIPEHTPLKNKPKVTVRPYYVEFHKDILDRLANLDSYDRPSEEDNSHMYASLCQDNVQSIEDQQEDYYIEPVDQPSASSVKDRIQQLQQQNIQETSSQPSGYKKHIQANYEMVASPSVKEKTLQLQQQKIQETSGSKKFTRHSYEMVHLPQDSMVSLSGKGGEKQEEVNTNPPMFSILGGQKPRQEDEDTMVSLYVKSSQHQAEHQLTHDPYYDHVNEDALFQDTEFEHLPIVTETETCEETPLKSVQPPPTPLPKPKPKPKPSRPQRPPPEPEATEKILQDVLSFSKPHVKLLETRHKVETEFPMCQVTYDTDNGKIKIEGCETKLQELKLKLYEENHKICQDSLLLPPNISDIIETEKGKSFLDKALNSAQQSVWYLDESKLVCVSFADYENREMIGRMKRLIRQEYVSYNESHFNYLKTSLWFDLKQSLEKNQLVRVECERDKKQIKIDGLGKDVDVSKQRIEEELKSHSHKDAVFSLSGAKAKCLKGCFTQDLSDIKKIISNSGGHWDDTGSMNSLHVKFHGDPNAVKKAENALKQLVGKVWHERLMLSKDVAKEKDLNLLIRGLHRSNLKAVQAAFEAQHSVFLELALPGVKKQLDMGATAAPDQSPAYRRRDDRSRSLSRTRSLEDVNSDSDSEEFVPFPTFHQTTRRPQIARHHSPPRRPMATSTKFGNITVVVKKGNITKEKADVLVNVVSKNLDLSGTAVSQAFLKAGGPEFKQQYDMVKGNWAEGGIIQTNCVGNLPGKVIYTIALDKWKPPGSKTELKTVIEKCLKTAAANGYTTIGLTSAGCGKLFHYPEKFVASCLVNAVKSNSGLSNLKQVSMVLYDQATYQVFLNEINPAPRPMMRHSSTYADLDDLFGKPAVQSETITVGSTRITVQQGDVTKSQATVLVNVITEDLNLGSTAVSQAFARAGGEDLLTDFEAQKNSPAIDNIIVTTGGNLKCSFVYHVILKKWSPGAIGKGYQKIIHNCFKLAGGYNTKSIAFPSLGCGVLFKYPDDFVASSLIAEAKSASISMVTFVIYDRPVFNTFLQELRSSSNDSDDNSEDLGTLRKYAKSSYADRVPSSDNKSANIVIYGANKQMCTTAKGALIKQLQADYLHVEIIKNENLTRLRGKTLASLKTSADKNGIWIKFPDPDKKTKKDKPELKLKGEKNSVLFVKSQIQEILMNVIVKTIPKPLHTARGFGGSRGSRGSRQFLQEMASMSEFSSPSYWTHFKAKHPLRDIMSNILAKFTGPKQVNPYKLEQVDQATFNAIDTLVQKTWDSTLVGQGKDAVGLAHQGIKVKQIQRLEHPEMFTKYSQIRSRRFSDACANGAPFTSIGQLPGSKSEARTTMFASAILQEDMYPEVNEHYFFHGTKPVNLQAILTQGLDSRVGNTQAMFGSGIYGAESSTKADQYTDDKNGRTPGDKQMVLMRMTLGHPYVCSTPKKYCRPPCKDLKHLDDKCNKTHGFFHSVVGDGHWLFREFVVYEPDLCYPEYIITYSRV